MVSVMMNVVAKIITDIIGVELVMVWQRCLKLLNDIIIELLFIKYFIEFHEL